MLIADSKHRVKETFQQDASTTTLKIMLIGIAVVMLLAALFVQNKWFLSLMLAWIIMP